MGNKELKKINWVAIACGFILVLQAVASFPSIRVEGRTIRLFAFEGMFRGDLYHGRVLGNHVLETEHGQIRLGHGSSISVSQSTFVGIDVENFVDGRASHNLIVYGIEMPKKIRVSFSFNPIELSLLRLYRQEIVISDVALVVNNFDLTHPGHTADVVMTVHNLPEYVILADAAQIWIDPFRGFLGGLRIYKDAGVWVLRNVHSGIPVKLPDETEFVRYRSITFRQDWGEFITGELFDQ